MPGILTPNLYREEEVAAAAAWWILRGRLADIPFWLAELSVAAAWRVVRQCWLYGFGPGGFAWSELIAAADGDPVPVALSLARARGQRDASVVAVLGLRRVVPDRVAALPVPVGIEGERNVFLARAILHGKVATVWAGDPSWELLERVGTAKHGAEFWKGVEATRRWAAPAAARAFAVAVACMTPAAFRAAASVQPILEIPPEVAKKVEDWKGLRGRARRALVVPGECLYGLTGRGWLSPYESSEAELMDMGQLREALGDVPAASDADAYEAYFDRRFPEDIPDEWSAADRQKSHGRGVNNQGGVCTRERLLDRWFGVGYPCSVLWGGVKERLAELEAELRPGLELEDCILPIEGEGVEVMGEWNYRPVKRKVEVAQQVQPVRS
jgi:hypothetical protein